MVRKLQTKPRVYTYYVACGITLKSGWYYVELDGRPLPRVVRQMASLAVRLGSFDANTVRVYRVVGGVIQMVSRSSWGEIGFLLGKDAVIYPVIRI